MFDLVAFRETEGTGPCDIMEASDKPVYDVSSRWAAETEGACSEFRKAVTLHAGQAMNSDQTQHQDDFEQQRSQELSRQRSRPPLDIPGYEPRQFLGTGAYGEVWVAIDKNTGRKVAIKFYTQKSGVDWSQLSREVEKLVFLSADRYVVQLLDVGWDAEPPYYVMEYVEGGSLQQFLEKEGPLPVGEAVEMFREIATGLLHAHGKGVLHCDLKPDNILLDQDRKPRLADFGQSRLSHEQTPALGTLFFMAPEQADLNAVPDARWDVYALGALLYCMLTGTSPYRSEALLSEIDSSPTLGGRLETYRNEIKNAPAPNEHRKVKGIDRELLDIVDRCLAVDPEQRFPNVQSVLTSIRSRDAVKDRKPLLLLGLLGPLLFLSVLGLYGFSASRKSVVDSDKMVRNWAHESSRFASKFVAEAVARRIDNYYSLVEGEAGDTNLQKEVQTLADTMKGTLELLADNEANESEKDIARQEFVNHTSREKLAARMERLVSRPNENVASWFVTDANGVQLASSIRNEKVKNSTVGFDYSRRAYFHGGEDDFSQRRHYFEPALAKTKLSPVFRSEASGTWKVAVSTPILAEGRAIGVIALTVELGNLGEDEEFSSDRRFITLVDGRQGTHRGQILQHPLFTKILADQSAKHDGSPKLRDFSEYRVPLDSLPKSDEPVETVSLYQDPLAAAPEAAAYNYDRNWIAAQAPVKLKTLDTGLIVLVQEDYDSAAAPVRRLGGGLLENGLWALALALGGVLYLWYLVTRVLGDPNEAMRRAGGVTVTPSSLHSMETLELPEKLRDAQRRSG